LAGGGEYIRLHNPARAASFVKELFDWLTRATGLGAAPIGITSCFWRLRWCHPRFARSTELWGAIVSRWVRSGI